MSYDIREVQLDRALSLWAESWKACNARVPDLPIHYNPDWIAEHFNDPGNIVSDLDQLEFAAPPWASTRPTKKENVRAFVMVRTGRVPRGEVSAADSGIAKLKQYAGGGGSVRRIDPANIEGEPGRRVRRTCQDGFVFVGVSAGQRADTEIVPILQSE
jgi:hypothetical protein